jgi:hypothetical protein
MKSSIPLSEALQRAARTLDAEQPPPQLRALIHARLQPAPQAQPASSGVASSRRPWAWSGAVGCAAVLLVSVVLMLRQPGPWPAGFEGTPSAFVPLAPPDRWPADAAAAWLVRTELRGDRLAALGLPFDPAHAGDSVRAELLVHPSGELLAVRFVR